MAYTVEKVLEIARNEIGYQEKESNKQLDSKTANAGDENYTKYARDLAAAGYYQASKQSFAWCDVWHDWIHYIAAGKNADEAQRVTCQSGPYGAGCKWSAKYYKDVERFYTSDPQPGDQIFFRNYAHTGIVEKVENGIITTIEGNTSNQVARRTYSISSPDIDGYGRPRYDVSKPAVNDAPVANKTNIKKGNVVTISNGAVYYSGKPVPSWVIAEKWIVDETPVGDRVVINKSTNGKYSICSPINAKYLTVVASNVEQWIPDVGDIVNFTGSTHYIGANSKIGASCKPGKAKITRIYKLGQSKHPYHLVRISGSGSTVYGWVDADTFTKA